MGPITSAIPLKLFTGGSYSPHQSEQEAEPALRPWDALEVPGTPTWKEVVTPLPRGAIESVLWLHIWPGVIQIASHIWYVPEDEKELQYLNPHILVSSSVLAAGLQDQQLDLF